jgi:aminoglycoside phosphotransferase (APT) family kinase protein
MPGMDAGDGYGLEPLAGGWSGETFLADAAGERSVVRIYARSGAVRGAHAPEIDAALLRLVRGLLPVPEVREVRRADPVAGSPGLLVTSFLPGERLDLLLPRLDDAGRARVGAALGVLLARLAQMPMRRVGLFADPDLTLVGGPSELDDLPAWVAHHRATSRLADWPAREYDALLEVSERAEAVLDPVDRACLVHSDLNPKNLLVDPGTLAVTGVLDWEFAHAGLPCSDLGNLLRFDRDPAFAEAVLTSYQAGVPDAPSSVGVLLDRARAADLVALVELAGRRGENPVTEQAHALLTAIARTGDLHAVP